MIGIGRLKCDSYDVVCGVFYCVDGEKALINKDEHQDRKLHVKLRILVVETRLGRFWNDFFPLFKHATLIILCIYL